MPIGTIGLLRRLSFGVFRPALLVALLALGACHPVDTWRDLTGASKDDPNPETTPNTKNLAAGEAAPSPNLATVPEPPTQALTTAQRDKLAQSLIADRTNAKYTDEKLRAGFAVATAAPPPPPPPAPPTADTGKAASGATAPPAEAPKATPLRPRLQRPAAKNSPGRQRRRLGRLPRWRAPPASPLHPRPRQRRSAASKSQNRQPGRPKRARKWRALKARRDPARPACAKPASRRSRDRWNRACNRRRSPRCRRPRCPSPLRRRLPCSENPQDRPPVFRAPRRLRRCRPGSAPPLTSRLRHRPRCHPRLRPRLRPSRPPPPSPAPSRRGRCRSTRRWARSPLPATRRP